MPQKSVTHVSERLLPMSQVHTGGPAGGIGVLAYTRKVTPG